VADGLTHYENQSSKTSLQFIYLTTILSETTKRDGEENFQNVSRDANLRLFSAAGILCKFQVLGVKC
jgi:hypothetical protein